MDYTSHHLEKAVQEIHGLPGIGEKTALRLALHLLRTEEGRVRALAESLVNLKTKVKRCENCGNLSDTAVCHICQQPNRQHDLVCVVEDIRDVMAIEHTGQYRGIYHVLGGVISPMDGIGPGDLNVARLEEKAAQGELSEVILALRGDMEGDTTSFYLYKRLKDHPVKLSTLARGIAVGDQLEYTDEVTLGQSIARRVPYQG
jgi:recombination protein RecR